MSGMPSKYAIAYWWSRNQKPPHIFVLDLGEPACFACGLWKESWDKPSSIGRRWEKARLERAHIIAKSQSGSNAVSNFVLLCSECHATAPMSENPEHMLRWCATRESAIARNSREIARDFRNAGIDLDKLPETLTMQQAIEIARRAIKNSGTHCGAISLSSIVYNMAEILKQEGLANATSST